MRSACSCDGLGVAEESPRRQSNGGRKYGAVLKLWKQRKIVCSAFMVGLLEVFMA